MSQKCDLGPRHLHSISSLNRLQGGNFRSESNRVFAFFVSFFFSPLSIRLLSAVFQQSIQTLASKWGRRMGSRINENKDVQLGSQILVKLNESDGFSLATDCLIYNLIIIRRIRRAWFGVGFIFYPQTLTKVSHEQVATPRPLSATAMPVIRFSCPERFPNGSKFGSITLPSFDWMNECYCLLLDKAEVTVVISFEEIPHVNGGVIGSGKEDTSRFGQGHTGQTWVQIYQVNLNGNY